MIGATENCSSLKDKVEIITSVQRVVTPKRVNTAKLCEHEMIYKERLKLVKQAHRNQHEQVFKIPRYSRHKVVAADLDRNRILTI